MRTTSAMRASCPVLALAFSLLLLGGGAVGSAGATCIGGAPNGILDAGEECDDGNFDNSDNCRANCVQARCGDGILHKVGACVYDVNGGHYSYPCTFDYECYDQRCRVIGTVETCDDGNLVGRDGCSATCGLEGVVPAYGARMSGAVNGSAFNAEAKGAPDGRGTVRVTLPGASSALDPVLAGTLLGMAHPAYIKPRRDLASPFAGTSYSYKQAIRLDNGSSIDVSGTVQDGQSGVSSVIGIEATGNIPSLSRLGSVRETLVPLARDRIAGSATLTWKTSAGATVRGFATSVYALLPGPVLAPPGSWAQTTKLSSRAAGSYVELVASRVAPRHAAISKISPGSQHTCMGEPNYCWGSNYDGEHGDGTTVRPPPGQPYFGQQFRLEGTWQEQDDTVVMLDCGGAFNCCAVVSDGFSAAGRVECWGNPIGFGGNSPAPVLVPTAVAGLTSATQVMVNTTGNFACARLTGGEARCWGRNSTGQLGDGTTTDSATPVAVSGLSGVVSVVPGSIHACALLDSGQVKCWGTNSFGELGNGTTTDSRAPVAVTGISTAIAIAAGSAHSCAVLRDGTVWCWGYGDFGEAGSTDNHGAHPIAGVVDAVAVTAGDHHTCALSRDGSVWCWGKNDYGQLGRGTKTEVLNNGLPHITFGHPVAARVIGLPKPVSSLDAGDDTTCVVLTDNARKCWGKGELGNLTDGKEWRLPPEIPGQIGVADGSPTPVP